MIKYKIDKNIPMPLKAFRYQLAEMTIGDSFFVPIEDLSHCKDPDKTLRNSLYAKKKKLKFKVKFTIQKNEKGFRVWRIE